MANTRGEKELKRDWPSTSGITGGTTTQEGRISNLLPEGFNGKKTIVRLQDRTGL